MKGRYWIDGAGVVFKKISEHKTSGDLFHYLESAQGEWAYVADDLMGLVYRPVEVPDQKENSQC